MLSSLKKWIEENMTEAEQAAHERVLTGQTPPVVLTVSVECPYCGGTGSRQCDECDGQGVIGSQNITLTVKESRP